MSGAVSPCLARETACTRGQVRVLRHCLAASCRRCNESRSSKYIGGISLSIRVRESSSGNTRRPTIRSADFISGPYKRFIRFVLDEFTPVGNHTEQVIKARNYQDPDQGAHEHPADRGGANGAV